MSEIWMPIPTYENYEASNLGNVRSLNFGLSGNARLLKLNYQKKGYQKVSLSKDGKVKFFLVHRLVMLAFVGECPEGLEVSHLNGVPDDNRLENLAYVTPKENNSHKLLHGTSIRGEEIGNSILTEVDVLDICRSLASGERHRCIAAKYGISKQTVSSINNGTSWSWLTGK